VRCARCETQPISTAHYCECCGERVTAADPSTRDERHSSEKRCGSCGGPSGDVDICGSCQQAFDQLFVREERAASVAAPIEPANQAAELAHADSSVPDDEEDLWSQLMNTAAPPSDYFQAASTPVSPTPVDSQPSPHAPAVAIATAPVAAVSVPAAQATASADAAPPTQLESPVLPTQPARRVEPTPQIAIAQPQKHDGPRAPRPQRPNAISTRPPASARRTSPGLQLALAVLAIVATAAGAGAYWLTHRAPAIVREQQPTAMPAEQQTVAAREPARAQSSVTTTSTTTVRASAAAQPAAARSRATKSLPTPSTKATVAVRNPSSVAPPMPGPATTTNEHAAAISIDPTPDPTPTPSPAPAAGPFFETKDVNEPPRVQRRVEPQVPVELRARAVNEIVIVRVLVSQGGHPSRVSLLRRSKTGPPLDDAVVAAVNRWTFSPARKRGEAVSCWLNIGVPVAN
jgi:TonB family protein